MGYFNTPYNTKHNSQSNSTYSCSTYTNIQYAEQQHEAIRGLVMESKDTLTRQDRKIAKLATERENAYKIYEQKRNDHITAKKDRAAVKKHVKHAEKAFSASKRKILALNRMDRAGPRNHKNSRQTTTARREM